MNPWWKIGLIAAFLAVYALGIWHLHTVFDEAKEAKELADEIAAHQKDQQAANDHAADLEKDLAKARQNVADSNQKMEAELAKHKTYTDCRVPDDGIRLRNQAAVRAYHPSR